MVARATRRARQAGRSPLITRDQTRPEPVAELDGLAEVGLAGLGGQPDRGGELGHRELPDQGCAGSGDRHPGLAVVPHRGRLGQGVDRVHRRPGHRRLQLARLRGVGEGGSSRAGGQHRGGGVEVGGAPCHGLIPAPTTDTQAPKTGFSTGLRETIFEKFSGPLPGPATARSRPADSRRRGLDRLDHRVGVVSTGSTTEGSAWSRQARPPRVRRGLDRLDHRPAVWSRRARPPGGCGVGSTGSTTDLRPWSRQARPPACGVGLDLPRPASARSFVSARLPPTGPIK